MYKIRTQTQMSPTYHTKVSGVTQQLARLFCIESLYNRTISTVKSYYSWLH